jgi:hypothetical protein
MKKVEPQIEKGEPSILYNIWNFLRSLPTKSFKVNQSLKILFFTALFSFATIAGSSPGGDLPASAQTVQLSKSQIYVRSVKKRANDRLVNEVENYILKMAPESKLNSEVLVQICNYYDLDIIFVLAQGLLESHFGTRGKAKETNSVWNVGTYDNGKIIYRYDNPNESIEPYARLVHEKYLMLADSIQINDKGILELVQDRGYTNYNGRRFASANRYESSLRTLMVKIDMETSISMYQGISRMNEAEILAYFGPPSVEEEIDAFYLQAMR